MALMADQKRKHILSMFRGPRLGKALMASSLEGQLDIGYDEAVQRLQALVHEGVLEATTLDGVKMYTLTRTWRDKLRGK